MGKHLTSVQGCQIAALHQAELTQVLLQQIAVSQSAVCREQERNRASGGYVCEPAHEAPVVRRSPVHSCPRKITRQVMQLIGAMLWREEWGPQHISCRLALMQQFNISHERIYQHV